MADIRDVRDETGLVTIICRVPGMRRLGIAHPASETYPADRWSADELEVFRRDPAFAVHLGVPAVAPGADTADAIRDNGAGPPQPDLGAKPDGTGPAARIATDDGVERPAVVSKERIEAIRAQLGALLPSDMTAKGEPKIEAIERLVGFAPTRAEVEAAQKLIPAVEA